MRRRTERELASVAGRWRELSRSRARRPRSLARPSPRRGLDFWRAAAGRGRGGRRHWGTRLAARRRRRQHIGVENEADRLLLTRPHGRTLGSSSDSGRARACSPAATRAARRRRTGRAEWRVRVPKREVERRKLGLLRRPLPLVHRQAARVRDDVWRAGVESCQRKRRATRDCEGYTRYFLGAAPSALKKEEGQFSAALGSLRSRGGRTTASKQSSA